MTRQEQTDARLRESNAAALAQIAASLTEIAASLNRIDRHLFVLADAVDPDDPHRLSRAVENAQGVAGV